MTELWPQSRPQIVRNMWVAAVIKTPVVDTTASPPQRLSVTVTLLKNSFCDLGFISTEFWLLYTWFIFGVPTINLSKWGAGAYSDSRGLPGVRQEIANFILERDGYPRYTFLTPSKWWSSVTTLCVWFCCGIIIGVTCWLDIWAVFMTCHSRPSVIWHLSSCHVLL